MCWGSGRGRDGRQNKRNRTAMSLWVGRNSVRIGLGVEGRMCDKIKMPPVGFQLSKPQTQMCGRRVLSLFYLPMKNTNSWLCIQDKIGWDCGLLEKKEVLPTRFSIPSGSRPGEECCSLDDGHGSLSSLPFSSAVSHTTVSCHRVAEPGETLLLWRVYRLAELVIPGGTKGTDCTNK